MLHRQTVYMMSALCVLDMKLRDVCVQVMEKSVREIQVTEFLWELGGWLRLYRGVHTLRAETRGQKRQEGRDNRGE